MQINHCLILAAGFGTRMGTIGQQLPKVLWPVFEKPLLQLQVAYARSLGISNIYINLHYMGEQIEASCKNNPAFEGVTFLWEKPEILDIGGAIHNLASQPQVKYKGKLLVLNADQFFYMVKDDLYKFLEPFQKHSAALFSYEVNTSQGYNALEIGADRLVKKIIQNKDLPSGTPVETYTGISFVDLGKLEKIPGKSAFFDSVCPFEKTPIPAILLKNVDYWDFGTLKRYWETSHRLLNTYRTRSTHPFIRFLVQEKALKTWKINLQNLSYNARSSEVINLNQDPVTQDLQPTIIMDGACSRDKNPMVWWKGVSAEVK
ncbi:MAG TPA: sugar phosphate nucleotidyltransferase [Bacteriovoracaceae bacterium]|nr:sugar phosphate nucleotidyltransferase [Bacteriovoracaceae bacterium]